jgi:hypothetical protein
MKGVVTRQREFIPFFFLVEHACESFPRNHGAYTRAYAEKRICCPATDMHPEPAADTQRIMSCTHASQSAGTTTGHRAMDVVGDRAREENKSVRIERIRRVLGMVPMNNLYWTIFYSITYILLILYQSYPFISWFSCKYGFQILSKQLHTKSKGYHIRLWVPLGFVTRTACLWKKTNPRCGDLSSTSSRWLLARTIIGSARLLHKQGYFCNFTHGIGLCA